MLIRTARFPGRAPGETLALPAAQPEKPRREPVKRRPSKYIAPLADCQAVAVEAQQCIRRSGIGVDRFHNMIGQSTNWRNGFFAKAKEGRLRESTIAKVRAVIAKLDGRQERAA